MKKLNLACGKDYKKGFINLDIDEECKPDIVASVLKLPFENNSIEYINCDHLVEHFLPEDAELFFSEVYRVLKKGCKASMKVDKDWNKKKLMKKDPTHKYRYKAKELLKIVDKFSKKEVKDKIYFFKITQARRKIFIYLVK